MYFFYSALLAAGLLLSLPYWMLTRRRGKYREGLGERLGRVPSRLRPQPDPAIWVHAVSVGEVLAVSALVKELRRSFPQYRVAVSTTTATGQKLAKQHFGENSVFYFPQIGRASCRKECRSRWSAYHEKKKVVRVKGVTKYH